MNSEYSLIKSNESEFDYTKYRITVETDDLELLKFLDSNIDNLIDKYAAEEKSNPSKSRILRS